MDIANHESIPVTFLKDAKVDSEKFREIIFTYSRFYNPFPSSSSSPSPLPRETWPRFYKFNLGYPSSISL